MDRRDTGEMTRTALTIAGSDSGGGAGIQADLKTFAALGVYGASAITALTAQNTRGVGAIHWAPPQIVAAQIEAVVKEAMFPAFMEGRRELESADLKKAAGQMVPLAKSHAPHIEKLRSLVGDGLARNASKVKEKEAVEVGNIRGGRLLDV